MHKAMFKRPRRNGRETIDYRITILHTKPKFGKRVEFVSTYYAREKKNKQWLEQALLKAFKQAHPLWTIKEVTVQAISSIRYLEKGTLQTRVLIPEETATQRQN